MENNSTRIDLETLVCIDMVTENITATEIINVYKL